MVNEITLRTYQPGDPSKVCYFQYKLYRQQYGFNGYYEQEMLRGMAELYDDLEGNQMWIAELNGTIVGDSAVIKKGRTERSCVGWAWIWMCRGRGSGTSC